MSSAGHDDLNHEVITLANARDLAKASADDRTSHGGAEKSTQSGSVGSLTGTVKILERLRSKGMLVPDSTLSAEIRGEYRRIKRPLLSNAFGKTSSLVDMGNVIMVTSAVPGEGKTYTATNLALAFAQERDHTVLLVDCDVTKQGVSRLLGIERRRPDFTDLLASENMPIEDALLRTDVPGLMLLPAGKPHEYITEMVASQRMQFLVNEFATRYKDRIVVLDAPPLISTPESQVLAGLVGQIVYVIEAGKTPLTIVQDAIGMLPDDKAVGVVLNKSESISNRGGYYYNYYKSYGETLEDDGKADT
jgi:exopolysaccharide/PEP-CTERM locus tyrosine autokinase